MNSLSTDKLPDLRSLGSLAPSTLPDGPDTDGLDSVNCWACGQRCEAFLGITSRRKVTLGKLVTGDPRWVAFAGCDHEVPLVKKSHEFAYEIASQRWARPHLAQPNRSNGLGTNKQYKS